MLLWLLLSMHEDPGADTITPVNEPTVSDNENETEDLDSAVGPEHSLLNNQRLKAHPERQQRDYQMTPLGRLRAYWLGMIVCIGGFLCKFAHCDAIFGLKECVRITLMGIYSRLRLWNHRWRSYSLVV